MDSYGFPVVPKHDRKLLGVLRRYVDNTVSLRVERMLSEQEWASLETCLFNASKIQYNSETNEVKSPQWMPAIGSVRQTLEAIIGAPSSEPCSRRNKGSSPPTFNTTGSSQPKDNTDRASSPIDWSPAYIVRQKQAGPRKDSRVRNAPSAVDVNGTAPAVEVRQPQRPRPQARRSHSAPLHVRFAQEAQQVSVTASPDSTSRTLSPDASAPSSQQSVPVAGAIEDLMNQASQLSCRAMSSSDPSSDASPVDSQTLSSSTSSSAPQIVSKNFQHYHHATAGILRQAAPLTSTAVSPTRATSQLSRTCSHPIRPPFWLGQSFRTE